MTGEPVVVHHFQIEVEGYFQEGQHDYDESAPSVKELIAEITALLKDWGLERVLVTGVDNTEKEWD